jgi:hypothetical protein
MIDLLKLKAKELHSAMEDMGFQKDEIMQSEKRYKPMKDLHQLIKSRMDEKHKVLMKDIQKIIENHVILLSLQVHRGPVNKRLKIKKFSKKNFFF